MCLGVNIVDVEDILRAVVVLFFLAAFFAECELVTGKAYLRRVLEEPVAFACLNLEGNPTPEGLVAACNNVWIVFSMALDCVDLNIGIQTGCNGIGKSFSSQPADGSLTVNQVIFPKYSGMDRVKLFVCKKNFLIHGADRIVS